MHNQQLATRRLGRHRHLSLALSLALGISSAPALATAPQSIAPTPTGETVLATSTLSGEPTRQTLMNPAHPAASGSATAGTITVTNCQDTGTGSLRWAVANASDGDTIDMSGQTGCTLKLNSSIVTSVDNLTIKGVPESKYPILDAQNAVVPIKHFGYGTLALSDVTVRNGFFQTNSPVTRGSCLFSSGNITLTDSSVKYCKAENTSSGTVQGGAVAALGNVTLSGSTVLGGTAENSGTGAAQGGAIWSQGTIKLDDASTVANSKALTNGSGSARGGGTWSQNGTTISKQSIVDGNTAQAYGNGSAIGGGVYATGNLTVGTNSVISNNVAESNTSFASGGGAQTGGTATVKYSQIEDNRVTSATSSAQGGGLRTDDTLMTKYTTISGNESSSLGGGVIARGNVSLRYTTISGNKAKVVGGLDLIGTNATQNLIIDQSTISGNISTNSKFGAGIYVGHDTDIRNSTITGNVESNPSNTKYGAGLSVKHDVNVDLSSTIISDNKLDDGSSSIPDSDIAAAIGGSNATLTGDYNLIGISLIGYPGTHGISNGAPGLGPLQDNGGLTKTHAVLPGSPAIDAGKANSFTQDQRGTGFKRTVGADPDIGAFELGGDRIFANGFETP